MKTIPKIIFSQFYYMQSLPNSTIFGRSDNAKFSNDVIVHPAQHGEACTMILLKPTLICFSIMLVLRNILFVDCFITCVWYLGLLLCLTSTEFSYATYYNWSHPISFPHSSQQLHSLRPFHYTLLHEVVINTLAFISYINLALSLLNQLATH